MKQALILFTLLLATPLFAQEPATERNPLVELRDEVKKVLAGAGVPFTDQQEKSIALMMEDRRQASEELFGQLMDYRNGPVQGQQQDRAVAAMLLFRTLATLRSDVPVFDSVEDLRWKG